MTVNHPYKIRHRPKPPNPVEDALMPLAHIKVEGASECPACGCPVKDFDKEPCR